MLKKNEVFFQHKDSLSTHRKYHIKDRTVAEPSNLNNEKTYSSKMVSLYGGMQFRMEFIIHAAPTSVAYMWLWISSALVPIMACRLFGAKPLPETMLTYCQSLHGMTISPSFVVVGFRLKYM